MNSAAFNGDGDGLRKVFGPESLHDVLNVYLHRRFGGKQSVGDVAVAIASGDLLEDLNFACGKVFVGAVLDQVRRNGRRNAPAGAYLMNGGRTYERGGRNFSAGMWPISPISRDSSKNRCRPAQLSASR